MKSKKVLETGEKLPEGRQMIGCARPQKASALSNLHRDPFNPSYLEPHNMSHEAPFL